MATYSNIPAWRIPWTEEPGRLQSDHKESDTLKQHAQPGSDSGLKNLSRPRINHPSTAQAERGECDIWDVLATALPSPLPFPPAVCSPPWGMARTP